MKQKTSPSPYAKPTKHSNKLNFSFFWLPTLHEYSSCQPRQKEKGNKLVNSLIPHHVPKCNNFTVMSVLLGQKTYLEQRHTTWLKCTYGQANKHFYSKHKAILKAKEKHSTFFFNHFSVFSWLYLWNFWLPISEKKKSKGKKVTTSLYCIFNIFKIFEVVDTAWKLICGLHMFDIRAISFKNIGNVEK